MCTMCKLMLLMKGISSCCVHYVHLQYIGTLTAYMCTYFSYFLNPFSNKVFYCFFSFKSQSCSPVFPHPQSLKGRGGLAKSPGTQGIWLNLDCTPNIRTCRTLLKSLLKWQFLFLCSSYFLHNLASASCPLLPHPHGHFHLTSPTLFLMNSFKGTGTRD